MAILDIFKKKEEEKPKAAQPIPATPTAPAAPAPAAPAPPAPATTTTEVPLNQVISMQQQGLSNNQIIQTLQRQGYQQTQIYDALAQSEAKKSIEPMSMEGPGMARAEHPDTEAVVEQIIEEKWTALQKDLTKINEWKDNMSSRADKMEQSIQDLRSDLEGLHKAIVNRIGEYDKTLVDVGTEIKAMEKVFQKVLPELTTNIQELSKITKNVKGKKPELGKIPPSLAGKLEGLKPKKKKEELEDSEE